MDAKRTIEYWEGYKDGKLVGEEVGYGAGKKAGIEEAIKAVDDYLRNFGMEGEGERWLKIWLNDILKDAEKLISQA